MRVLLINGNLKSDLFAAPPIGLCYVATATQTAGHEVRVVDLCFQRQYLQEVERAVVTFSPEVVGISIRNIDNVNLMHPISYLPHSVEIVGHIRKLTEVPLVVGGSGASLSPEGLLRLLNGDYIVVSDGEFAFVELLSCLEAGRSPDSIPGVGMIRGGRFCLSPPRMTDFAGRSANVGKWIDLKPYQKVGGSYNIQTKRGCRQQCIYCTYNQLLEGNRIRKRAPVDVVDEIEKVLFKYRPRLFEFVDSLFNDPADHGAEILEEICRRPWKARFTAMGMRPKHLDASFLDLMRRAGFTSFWVSPEAASATMLRNYRKGFTMDDLAAAVEAIHKTRFSVMWTFLIGGPGETNETLGETLDFTLKQFRRKDRTAHIMINYLLGVRIYPNTVLWDIALKEGFVDENTDALEQQWYLSRELDVERAVRQIYEAWYLCPEMSPAFQEKFMAIPRIATFFAEVFGITPYWRLVVHTNQVFLKLGLHRIFRPPDIAPRIIDLLRRPVMPSCVPR